MSITVSIAGRFRGTIGRMGHGAHHSRSFERGIAAAISYREFAPAPELSGVVRAYFSFMPYADRRGERRLIREAMVGADQPFNLPMLADARSSLVLDLTAICHVDRGWSTTAAADARVIGPRRVARQPAADDRAEMVGAYLEPGATLRLFGVSAIELTDRTLTLEDVWGTRSQELVADTSDLDEASRVDRLEAAMLARVRDRRSNGSVNIPAMTRWVQKHPNGATVNRLAEMAGVSRRHLARLFADVVGVSPKRFCRLARFKAGLAYAGVGAAVPWAEVARQLGYADQSHMIGEFRELSGLTPEMLASRPWFHPFILDVQRRAWSNRQDAEPASTPWAVD